MTRDELIGEIVQARNEWDSAVSGLAEEDFEAEISRGWNLKDIVGHLATYLRLNARHVASYVKRRKIVSMRARNWYQFNKREVARLKRAPLVELQKELNTAYKELLAVLPRLGDEDLKAIFVSPWSPQSEKRVRLGTILRADVSRHFRDHARDVRKWRERRNVAS